MRICFLVFLICCPTLMRAADATTSTEGPKEAKIVMNDQSFVLVGKDEGKSVSTYRYVPQGATVDDWAEMVTHQVIRVAARSGADEVLNYLKEKSSSGGIRMEPILETRKAAVFASLAPKTEKDESQVGVGFVFVDLVNPFEIHLISFALKPNRLGATEVDAKLRSWRSLFKARATALASS